MNKQNHDKPSLARIYRESTAHIVSPSNAELDAQLLIDATAGHLTAANREKAVAALANSAAEADLFRMLQALQPISAELAHDVAALSPTTVVPFKRPQPLQSAPAVRKHQPAQRWAWLAVAAAAVAAVFVAVPRDFQQQGASPSTVAQQPTSVPASDQIFRAEMGSRVASNRGDANAAARQGDTIFNSSTGRQEDAIFSGRFNGS